MKPDSKRSFSIPFDPVGRPTEKKPRSIAIAKGPRARREAVSVPSTSRVRRPLYDWHLGRERFLKREEEAFRAAPEHLDAIPKIFRHPYWRMRLGHALERAFAAENTALSDPGYVEQASGFLLTDLRRGAGRTATNPDAVPEYFSFDPDLGETGEEEYESDDFFDETSEDEELLPEAPEPEDDDVFDDESDDGETLSFLAPVGPDDPVAKAFREYWETTEAQPEYRRQLEVIEKACDKEFFDWFSLNMDDIRRSCFLAGNTSGYFTMPRPALLVRVLREAAKDEFPDEDWSPEVARDARFLRALWRLPRVNYALLAVSGVTGAVLGSIVAWYPTFIPVISTRVPNWEALTLAVRKRLWETEEGQRALTEVERLAADDERLQARAEAANAKDRRARKVNGDDFTPFIQHVWVNPRLRTLPVDQSLVYAFLNVVTKAKRASFYIGKIHGECKEFTVAGDVRTVSDGESPELRRIDIIDYGNEPKLQYFLADQKIGDEEAFFAEADGPLGDVLRTLETEILFADLSGEDLSEDSRFAWMEDFIDDDLMFRIEGPDEEEPEEDYDELERAAAKLPDEPEEDD